jgi:hypothetical protein
MNNIPLWAQLVIAIFGSGTIGGIAGAISSSFTSRQKIKELEVVNHQKIEENHRINTRQHIDTLYIPLNKILTKLSNQYDIFLDQSQNDDVKEASKELFSRACRAYIIEISDLFSQGIDIYLTAELAEKLRAFNIFIRASLTAEKPRYSIDELPPFERALVPMLPIFSLFASSRTKKEIKYELTYTQAAPIESVAFHRRFRHDIMYLQSRIRDVTLGTIPPK